MTINPLVIPAGTPAEIETADPMVDVLTYAAIHETHHRTVREWLRKGMLPGAVKDESGRWLIPSNARKSREATAPTLEVLEHPTPEHPAPFPRRPRAFFTVDEAAELLGLSPYRVRAEREAFEIRPWGPNGALLVPAHVVRRYLGI